MFWVCWVRKGSDWEGGNVSTKEGLSRLEGWEIAADRTSSRRPVAVLACSGTDSVWQLLRVSRAATMVVGLLRFALGLTTEHLVSSTVSYAWDGIGCSFAPTVLLTCYRGCFSGRGVVSSQTVGLFNAILWITLG